MTEPKMPFGCGVLGVFRSRSSLRNRRCSSTGSLPGTHPDPEPINKPTGKDDTSIGLRPANPVVPATKLAFINSKTAVTTLRKNNQIQTGPKPKPIPIPGNSISGELEAMLYDYQKVQVNNKLVRATSGNVMLYGNLGNIRSNKSSGKDPKTSNRVTGNLAKTQIYTGRGKNTVTGTRTSTDMDPPAVLCRALSKRLDPEELKEMGNVEFSNGKFAEALALYDRAIVLDPGKASYRSNKAAALTGLGRIMQAAGECKEAVRMDPGYNRAHNRLAGLYFRLGEATEALHHYKLSGQEADPSDISKAQTIQNNLAKCTEARRTRDWLTLLKQSRDAISFGVDSAPQVFAWQAEALLKLHKHDEADSVLNGAPKFDIDAASKILGAPINGYILMIQAQVDMAAGRFDEAVSAAQRAAQFDNSSGEISMISRRTKSVATSRSKGNEFFKNSKFKEACLAYGEGLDHDPHNATLLCNRAASRSKLNKWDKAIEDCNAALRFRPSYVKARMRRAYCNSKLERWQDSIHDYEILIKEIPDDEEVGKALSEAKSELQKRRKLVNNTAPL